MGTEPATDRRRVAIVLSDEHAQEIERLLLKGPVWALRTARTEALAERLWDGPGTAELTLFDAGAKPELGIGGALAQIEEHHGEASGNPPMAQIEAWGQQLSEALSKELSASGFAQIAALPHGFIASRTARSRARRLPSASALPPPGLAPSFSACPRLGAPAFGLLFVVVFYFYFFSLPPLLSSSSL